MSKKRNSEEIQALKSKIPWDYKAPPRVIARMEVDVLFPKSTSSNPYWRAVLTLLNDAGGIHMSVERTAVPAFYKDHGDPRASRPTLKDVKCHAGQLALAMETLNGIRARRTESARAYELHQAKVNAAKKAQ